MPKYKFTISKEIEVDAPNYIQAMDIITRTEGDDIEFDDWEEVNEDDD